MIGVGEEITCENNGWYGEIQVTKMNKEKMGNIGAIGLGFTPMTPAELGKPIPQRLDKVPSGYFCSGPYPKEHHGNEHGQPKMGIYVDIQIKVHFRLPRSATEICNRDLDTKLKLADINHDAE